MYSRIYKFTLGCSLHVGMASGQNNIVKQSFPKVFFSFFPLPCLCFLSASSPHFPFLLPFPPLNLSSHPSCFSLFVSILSYSHFSSLLLSSPLPAPLFILYSSSDRPSAFLISSLCFLFLRFPSPSASPFIPFPAIHHFSSFINSSFFFPFRVLLCAILSLSVPFLFPLSRFPLLFPHSRFYQHRVFFPSLVCCRLQPARTSHLVPSNHVGIRPFSPF